MIRDHDLQRMKREGMTLADVAQIARVLGGLEPFYVDHDQRSPCCHGPVGVYHGQIENEDGTPYRGGPHWRVPILRRCGKCGEPVEIPSSPKET